MEWRAGRLTGSGLWWFWELQLIAHLQEHMDKTGPALKPKGTVRRAEGRGGSEMGAREGAAQTGVAEAA